MGLYSQRNRQGEGKANALWPAKAESPGRWQCPFSTVSASAPRTLSAASRRSPGAPGKPIKLRPGIPSSPARAEPSNSHPSPDGLLDSRPPPPLTPSSQCPRDFSAEPDLGFQNILSLAVLIISTRARTAGGGYGSMRSPLSAGAASAALYSGLGERRRRCGGVKAECAGLKLML